MSYRAKKLVIDAHTDTHAQTNRHRQWQYPEAKTCLGVKISRNTSRMIICNLKLARQAVRGTQWPLENGRNSHWSHEPMMHGNLFIIQYNLLVPGLYSYERITQSVTSANWRPCLKAHNGPKTNKLWLCCSLVTKIGWFPYLWCSLAVNSSRLSGV